MENSSNTKINTPANYKDALSKVIASEFSGLFSCFLGLGENSFLQTLDKDLSKVEISIKEVDFLCELKGENILHVEFQMSKKEEFIVRNCEYDLRLAKKYQKHKIHSFTIFGPKVKPFKPDLRLSDRIEQRFIFLTEYKNKFDTKKAIETLKSGQSLTEKESFDLAIHCLSVYNCTNLKELIDIYKLANA